MPLSFEIERIFKMRQEFKEQSAHKKIQSDPCEEKTENQCKKISELIKKFRDWALDWL